MAIAKVDLLSKAELEEIVQSSRTLVCNLSIISSCFKN